MHLVSYSGLVQGDILLLEPGTSREEVSAITSFGSVHLAAPLVFNHPVGSPLVHMHRHNTGTPAQHEAIRNEAGRHHHRVNRVLASRGALSESVDSLEGFVADDDWSDVQIAHAQERHRRKQREKQRPVVRPLPAPPIVS